MSLLAQLRVAVIIPVYNENPEVLAATLADVLRATYPVILVDDGSVPVVQVPEQPDLVVVRHERNAGQGAAIRSGIDEALRLGYDAIVLFDADGQHQASDIPTLLQPILEGHADVVLGSRFIQGASVKMELSRKVILSMGRITHGLLYGIWLTDAHNGLKAFNRYALQQIRITEPRSAHASELLYEIVRNKLRWQEVPVQILYSSYSIAKGQKWWHAFGIAWRVCLHRLKRAVAAK